MSVHVYYGAFVEVRGQTQKLTLTLWIESTYGPLARLATLLLIVTLE